MVLAVQIDLLCSYSSFIDNIVGLEKTVTSLFKTAIRSGVGGKIAKHLSDEDAAISYQMLYFMVSDEVLLVLIHLFGLVHYCLGFLYVNLPHKGL